MSDQSAQKSLKELGKTGLMIPPVVFGTTSLGNLFRVVPDDEKAKIVQAWFGQNLDPVVIDSAGKYGAGLALEVIGREFRRLGIEQDAVLISNKLAWRRMPLGGAEPTFEPGAWFGLEHDAVQDISYEGVLRCWEDGCQLLDGYAAQLVSVHDPDEYLAAATDEADRRRRLENILDAYRGLFELKASGQVAAVGVGAKDWRTIRELSHQCELDWVMFANSLTVLHHPPELIEFLDRLTEQRIGIINSALFHGGFLLGGEFFDYRRVDPSREEDRLRLRWRERFTEICRQFDQTPFQVGVAFGRAHPGITAVALSSSRADRVPSHVAAVQHEVPQECWDALKDAGLIRGFSGLGARG